MYNSAVFHHFFINKCISSMIKGLADYFSTSFFDRSKEIIVSTYDKAVQHYKQRLQEPGEKTNVAFPFLNLDPGMDFEPDPQAGRFLWEYPSYANSQSLRMIHPKIYQDDHIIISVVLNRYRGKFDLNVWCSSIYELMDFRLLTIQLFGGQERYIYPKNITGYIILPDEVVYYTYSNRYTGQSYALDWPNNQSTEIVLIKNINQNKVVFPFTLRPWLKLVGVDSSTDTYGGGDSLSEHKLTISCEWECSIPTHLVLFSIEAPDLTIKEQSLFLDNASRIYLDIDIAYDYYRLGTYENGGYIDVPRIKKTYSYGKNKEDSEKWANSIEEELFFKTKYNYMITEADANDIHSDPPVDFSVELPEEVLDPFKLEIISKYGKMERDFHWSIDQENKKVVTFKSFNLDSLKKDDTLWFVFYE